ncbi:MAG: adenylate kinase [Dehalococcoidia bacterium]|nr:adenylate kinase [Dehalococcoidia bacterium]
MYVILLGAPGAGKGTQAVLLSQQARLVHLASGDLFREVRQQDTEIGRLVKSYYDKGELVPDDVTIRMILERLSQPDCQSGCLLDGFPRTLQQALALDDAFHAQGKRIERVVSIAVERAELLRRLGGRWLCQRCGASYHTVSAPPKVGGTCDRCGGELYQRADDTEETAKNRLDVYDRQTAPLVDYYRTRDVLAEVNGQGQVESVQAAVVAALR